jgi:hypothetical protein
MGIISNKALANLKNIRLILVINHFPGFSQSSLAKPVFFGYKQYEKRESCHKMQKIRLICEILVETI